MSEHVFKASLSWQTEGKNFTYKEYSRLYLVRSPGKVDFLGTAAPEFFGSPYHYNPEDLLVVSLSACHMLTYLAYATNSKLQVLSYEDDAQGFMHAEGEIIKFKEVILHPRLKIVAEADVDRAQQLHDKAHRACFIANSVNFPVKIEGEVVVAGHVDNHTPLQ